MSENFLTRAYTQLPCLTALKTTIGDALDRDGETLRGGILITTLTDLNDAIEAIEADHRGGYGESVIQLLSRIRDDAGRISADFERAHLEDLTGVPELIALILDTIEGKTLDAAA